MSVAITFKESTSDHDQLQACILFVSCSSYSDGVVEIISYNLLSMKDMFSKSKKID